MSDSKIGPSLDVKFNIAIVQKSKIISEDFVLAMNKFIRTDALGAELNFLKTS